MDSDDEYEQFQVTEEDLLQEFFPRKRKFTREDHIYGMWAQHDSDDEGSRNEQASVNENGVSHLQGAYQKILESQGVQAIALGRGDYARPVNFISAGKQRGEAEEDNDDSDPDEQALDEEAKTILEGLKQKRLDKGGKKVGIGKFHFAALEKNKKLGAFQTAANSSKEAKGKTRSKPSKNQLPKAMERDFGKWQKYTTGFGNKMLQKMGWTVGSGLGSSGEGIVNPVKARSWKEFGKGLTDVRSEGTVGRRSVMLEGEDSEDEEEQKEFEEQMQQWRRTEGGTKAKPKYVYKTVEELKQSSKRLPMKKTHTAVRVIDMTGRQKRELSSYEEIHDRHTRPDESYVPTESKKVFLPELLHNIQLLVDRTENEILQSDRRLRYNQDLLVNLSHERQGLEEEVTMEKKQIDKLSEILSTIETFEQSLIAKDRSPMTLTECEELMTSLQEKYPIEYKMFELSAVAVAVAFPMIKTHIQSWDMLKSPKLLLSIFSKWKSLLRENTTSQHTIPSSIDSMDPYDRLVWEVWMPKLRQTILSWSPRICNPVIDLLQLWMPLIPEWIMNNILELLVMPRLQTEVDIWDPTTDTLPIHAWVHPWLPLMEHRLDVLYAPIRYKLAIALNSWHPSDSSAHKILDPWVKVFSEETMEAFVVRTILPKLAYCLQTLPINPHQQDIAPFEWVLTWRDMIPVHHYTNMLDKHFFPKWLQVLQAWLSSNPNFDEVTKWYMGWKSMLDGEMLSEPIVKRHFSRALDMMNHAVAGTLQPGIRENMAYFTSTERRRSAAEVSSMGTQRIRGASLQNALSAPASLSFKDILEKMAEDNGILFMPVPGQKRYEGKALYSFGKATIYIDRGVVFTMRGGQWTPVSLDELRRLS